MKNRAPFPPGVISLCVVFISLCVSLLAMLTYSGAAGELKLAHASADNTAAVLEAERQLQYRLCEMEQVLDSGGVIASDRGVVTIEIEIDENRLLEAQVDLEPRPHLISNRIVYVGDWQPDSSLDVWDGQ